MTIAECIPGRKVRFDAPLAESRTTALVDFSQPHARDGWILYANPVPVGVAFRAPNGDRTQMRVPVSVASDEPQRVTVQYWSPVRCAWLTEQFTPEQLMPAPEVATDDVPGRPA